jgi:hypothetical protein
MTTERTQQHMYELNTESRLTKLETTNESILKTLSSIDARLDKIDTRFDKIDARLWQLLLIYGGGFLLLLTIMAHGFKWF